MYLPTSRQLPRLVLSKNVLYELAQKSKTFFSLSWSKNREHCVFGETRLSSSTRDNYNGFCCCCCFSLVVVACFAFFSFLLLMTLKERSTNRGVNGSPLEAINQPLYVDSNLIALMGLLLTVVMATL